MISDYVDRFGIANPDRFDTPARSVGLLFTAEVGWMVPESQRPADWRERMQPKPLVEKKPDYLAMQSILDTPPRNRRPPVRTKPGPGRPAKTNKKHKRPRLTEEQAVARRLAGESVVAMAKSQGCTIDAIYRLLALGGYKEKRECLECKENISHLHFKAAWCKKCQPKQKKFRATQAYRKLHQKPTGGNPDVQM